MEKDQERERKTKVEKIYNSRMEDGKRAEKGRIQKEGETMRNAPAKTPEVVDVASLPATTQGEDPVTSAMSRYDRIVDLAITNGDLDRLEKFMELRERDEANEARKAFHVAMSAFKANPPQIGKDKHVSYKAGNGTTEYSHASLANVTTTINKELSKHGLSATWKTDQGDKGLITVTCTISHVLGHSESTPLSASPDASGGKNAIQAIGSAVSYLQRYTILALTGLATHDQDDDGLSSEDVEHISECQLSAMLDMINALEVDEEKFCKFLGVNAVSKIPQSKYHAAMTALKSKEKHSHDYPR